MSVFVLIVHDVEDFAVWKAVFDGAAGIRKAAGETIHQVLSDDADQNRIVHFSQWTSIEAAKRFFQSPELIEIRKVAGVKSADFTYLSERASGDLGA